jgi:RNA polymerase sigma factor (sigma-70 family)
VAATTAITSDARPARPDLFALLDGWVYALARKLAWKFRGYGVDADDLYQEGRMALWLLPPYDPSVGATPKQYATRRVAGAMIDFLRLRHGVLPRVRRQQCAGRSAVEVLPLFAEDEVAARESPGPRLDSDADEVLGLIRSLGVTLTTREQQVVTMRVVEGLKLREVGDRLGITESGASRIETIIHDRIHAAIADRGRDWRTAFN